MASPTPELGKLSVIASRSMKLPRAIPTGWVKIWFYNLAGAQSTIVPTERATEMRRYLLAGGAIVWHTERYS